MTNVKELIEYEKPNFKQSTVKTYVRHLELIKEAMNGDDDYKFLDDFDAVVDSLKPRADSSIKTMFSPVLVLLKAQGRHLGETYKNYDNYIKDVLKKYNDVNNKYEMSEHDKANFLTAEELDQLIEKTEPKKFPKKSYEYDAVLFNLLLWLYRFVPSRNDFADMLIAKNNKEAKDLKGKNLLVLGKNPRFIFNEYKTNKVYGERVVPIDDFNLLYKIKSWLNINKNPKYLISNFKGEPISRNALTKRLLKGTEKHTGKKVASTLLRKTLMSQPNIMEQNKEMKALANKLGHSLNTQIVYIKKKKNA